MYARQLIILIATISIAADPPSREGAARKDLESIQGTWAAVMLEADGEQAPPEVVAATKLVFKDDKLTIPGERPGWENYIFRLDPTTKPASFEMTHLDGDYKSLTHKGIYSLETESLKICITKTDKRP